MTRTVHQSAETGRFVTEADAEANPDTHMTRTVIEMGVLRQAAVNYHALWRTFLSEVGNGSYQRKAIEDNLRDLFREVGLELPSDLRK